MVDCLNFTGNDLTLCELIAVGESSTNTFFILWASVWVFFMHAGFAMLSAGAVRMKNTLNILMCILLDAAMCGVAFWLCGFAFAYGEDKGGFIGASNFVGIDIVANPADDTNEKTYYFWFFQYAFAATAATIVSGAVAERATFEAYITYSFLLSFWIYPVCVHWIWGGGFLTLGSSAFNGVGCLDFAGDGPVHALGGLCGAIGSKIIGPRIGRYNADGSANVIAGHSSPLALLGTFILWVGWFGFNPGSALTIADKATAALAQRAAMNTLLSSATGALSSLLFSTFLKRSREWDLGAAMNGTLAGLVAITGCCSVVETWAAIIIGILGGILYILASSFTLNVLKIDDPLDATPVHFFVGTFGLFMVGFFANPTFVEELASFDKSQEYYAGVFYGGNGTLLLGQLIEFVCICAWVAVFITPYFLFLKSINWLRVSVEVEEAGIDSSSHGGHAYPEHAELELSKSEGNNRLNETEASLNQA